MTVIDAQQRAQALDITQSFIVQAPAGSGKTGVLTQRILKLLTVVERPEQILAITFTKKAAAEMRTRVAEALEKAAHGIAPDQPHERLYYDLATAALARDKLKNWHLLENLGRLRLQTIDSLCSSLVRENPLTSGLGAQFGVEEDAAELYREATRCLLAMLDDEDPVASALFRVLSHFDNQYSKVQSLIVQMLDQRDHWLKDIADAQSDWDGFKTLLTQSLSNINAEAEQRVLDALTPDQRQELNALTQYAVNNLTLDKGDHDLLRADQQSIEYRKQQFRLFLTGDESKGYKWRSRLDKNIGFPAGESAAEKKQATEYKNRAKALLEVFERGGDPFLDTVTGFIAAPAPRLSPAEWQLLEDLTLIVRYAAAHLNVVFRQRRAVDFNEIALAALLALGAEEAPSDALLSMDDRIAHILVDEFQDTSFIQIELLEKLTAGWSAGDGRTLFLVGDPMQSIYAFRKADVGLFLKLWHEQALRHVILNPLQLCMNFRSSPMVLDWVNDTFKQVFPRRDDIRSGAVSYATSTAGKSTGEGDTSECHLFVGPDNETLAQAEADWIADRIAALDKHLTVAILVKGKSHVIHIASALRARDIPYQAVDIEPLAESQIIIDLLALYHVCISPRNKTAWFALLRGPWCGLKLTELELFANAHDHPVHAIQALVEQHDALQSTTHAKTAHLLSAITQFYQRRLQQPFAEAMRELALEIGIAATARSEADIEAMELFFRLIAEIDEVGGYPDSNALQKKLAKLFVPPEPISGDRISVQMMTMHKSKGLEFDVVFLPQLTRKSRQDDKPLILVDKQTSSEDLSQELFMAPAANDAEQSSGVYRYLWQLRKQRSRNETARLLYVACTRARKQLFLTACLKQEEKRSNPDSGSLLANLWPVLESAAFIHEVDAADPVENPGFFRYPSQPLIPVQEFRELPFSTHQAAQIVNAEAAEEGADIHREAGILLHKVLEMWARYPHQIPAVLSESLLSQWLHHFHVLGFDTAQCQQAVAWVERGLTNLLKNPERRHWLLEHPHPQAQVEYALSSQDQDGIHHWVVDRTFVEAGVRHIIDYKLAEPAGNLEDFIKEESIRYAPQLANYRTILTARDGLPCRTYLYFPLIDHLQEVES